MEIYVSVLEKKENYRKVTGAVVREHVEYLRQLDEEGKMYLCGASKGYPGVAGMIFLYAENLKQAKELCKQEPMYVHGFVKHNVSTFCPANKENNYLL